MSLALDRAYRLSPRAALRDEPFGALAYHYDNRRLVFLKSRALVALVRDLDRHPTLDAALSEHARNEARAAYLLAAEQLERAEIILEREEDHGRERLIA
ncbi:MAG TPA: mycofactocin biosynthesis chaperone MftB [Solirubrobacteraceae bacterium]|jgi:putative mycofactocin binding protein MftB|nr:mycofactocin biosynthesis chaperone MftB [Solirubrobacteraceae bacterium]